MRRLAPCALRLAPCALLLSLGAGSVSAQSRSDYEHLQSLTAVLNHIRLNYVDSVGYAELVRAAINGVLQSLDPHSYYLTAEQLAARQAQPAVPAVAYAGLMDDGTAYVWLRSFGPGAGDQLAVALDPLRRGMRRLVLDLRGNPGGDVVQSVVAASLFLPRGTLVFRVTATRESLADDFVTERDGRYQNVPMAVLIDEATASAAEALAGSLQAHDRAVIVGRRSFGKALMQTEFDVPGGGRLWLTVGHVLTPDGRNIQRPYRGLTAGQYAERAGQEGGIVPDVEVPAQSPLSRLVRRANQMEPSDAAAIRALLVTDPDVAAARATLDQSRD